MTDTSSSAPSAGAGSPLLLRAGGVAVLLDVSGPRLPRVLHWGADPGDLDGPALEALCADLALGVPNAVLDAPLELTLLPGEPEGWSGRPALAGHRDGTDPFPRLAVTGVPERGQGPDGGQRLTVHAQDEGGSLRTTSELRLEPSGLLRLRHTVTNTGEGVYTLDGLTTLLPVPDRAAEILDLTGRWCRERSPQRRPFSHGTHARDSRRGRTGADATLLLLAGVPGFGFGSGEVWGVHVAWSGNHTHLVERLPEGAGAGGTGVLGGGELLLPGELRLEAGQSYTTPWTFFTYSADGLDTASARIHRWMRERPGHPRRPRPLVLNTWEAVYFDHDLERLVALAERGAQIGAERFVLDDGWFGARRDDTAGLGDWYVSPEVWPQGLRPLADRVRELGMEFGLWVEPEMVNVDSDLAREHPDWLLAPAPRPDRLGPSGVDEDRLPVPARGQYVLDVAQPGAYAYLFERLSALVEEIGVAYLKWDHNRDLLESLHPLDPAAPGQGRRRAGVHEQTLAVYRLLDELRARHPGLEIESCSSGGARVDLGILERTDRIWASDTNDAVERQSIQRWTGLLVPPELVGAHVGPPVAHTTGRALELSFRCVTALFGHAGMEWDVTTCTPEEVEQLQGWARLYKEVRALVHTGTVVRADTTDSGALVHGVVSPDRREGLFAYVRLATSPDVQPGRLRLPGLDAGTRYEVAVRTEAGAGWGVAAAPVPWVARGRAEATGAVLSAVGLPAPLLNPAQAVVLHLRATT